MDASTVLLVTSTVAGLYMAWNIGANDVGNAMGTSVGSGALTLRTALIVAGIFEFSGALLVGGSVTKTISNGIINTQAFEDNTMLVVAGMTGCLLAAAIWLHVATFFGWPVSTTHSIVGAVVGFGWVCGGFEAVHWSTISNIAASWIVSPLLGGALGYGCFMLIKNRILDADSPSAAMKRWGPVMVVPIFTILALSLIYKGLKPLKLDFSPQVAVPIALAVGVAAGLISIPFLNGLARRADRAESAIEQSQSAREVKNVERVFLVLQIFTACFVAFAHGSNDVANAVGPLAAVYSAMRDGLQGEVEVPMNILLIGAGGIVIGLGTYGYKVMETIGREITELTPSRGFSAEFSAAATIVFASKLGLPISTTHTLVGSVIGVGFARSFAAINLPVVRGIFASWLITVPFTALLSAGMVLILKVLL